MWWVYVAAIVFGLTLLFIARQEAYGPASTGTLRLRVGRFAQAQLIGSLYSLRPRAGLGRDRLREASM